jgi:hypothetical protein
LEAAIFRILNRKLPKKNFAASLNSFPKLIGLKNRPGAIVGWPAAKTG